MRSRKQGVSDSIVHPLLVHNRLTFQALALTPGPASYCREEPSSAVALVWWPSRQDFGGVLTVPLAGVGG